MVFYFSKGRLSKQFNFIFMSKQKYSYIEIPVVEISLEEAGEIPIEDKGIKEVIANFDFQQILKSLTPKQKKVAEKLAEKCSQREIAEELGISRRSVRDLITGIKKKLELIIK